MSDVASYALDTTWRTLLVNLGVPPANVLRRAGLIDDLFRQPNVRLTPDEYFRLWRGLEDALTDPLLPIRVCTAVQAESFSPALFAALCSPNLLVAAERIARYKRLIAPMRIAIVRARDTVTLSVAWLDTPPEPPASLVMMELLFLVQLARIGTRKAIRPVALRVPALPSELQPFETFLGVRPTHGDQPSVTFHSDDASRAFLTSNPALWAAFEPDLRQRLADLDASETTAKRVHAALLEGLPSGLATIEAVAARLGLAKRTLQRRIEAEGTTYQLLLNATRERLARHYLQKTAMPLTEIAFLLGFDEPNSFFRAFRNWTGSTPDAVRQQ